MMEANRKQAALNYQKRKAKKRKAMAQIRLAEILDGLGDIEVLDDIETLGLMDDTDEPIEINVRLSPHKLSCPKCGDAWEGKQYIHHQQSRRLVDVPAFGRKVYFVWHHLAITCMETDCSLTNFTELSDQFAPKWSRFTTRAIIYIHEQLAEGRRQNSIAIELGCDQKTVSNLSKNYILE